jgi:ADP-heptose:LPS heptosyltransferase
VTHVLVLRALGLGDLLTAVPALRGLRRAWPGSRVTLAAPAALGHWLASLGVVDDTVEVDGLEEHPRFLTAVGRPAVAVNLHGRGPQSHRLLARLGAGRLVAFASEEASHDGPPWRSDEHEVDRWIRLSTSAGGRATAEDLRLPEPGPRAGHVVVHPGAASASRCWPVDRWAAVAAALAAQGCRVVVTGTRAEAGRCAVVAGAAGVEDRCGRETFAALARTVGTARLLLSGDTGVAHLATAFGTPSVTLFGPVSPALWGPRVDGDVHRVLWRGGPQDLRPGNPHGNDVDERLAAIGVAEVIEEAERLLWDAQAVRGAPPPTTVADSSSSDA